jgi:hypothetical protein
MAKQSSAAREAQPAQPVATQSQRWEFASETLVAPGSEPKIFERYSSAGWELVSVTESANHDRRYYFKRPI